MCTRCDPDASLALLSETIRQGEAVLASLDGFYRRPLTPVELAYGDVPRVRREFDEAAERITTLAAPVVRKIARQLVEEAVALAKAKDVAGISRITPSYVGELASALKAGLSSALEAGKRQVLDQHGAQTGTSLAGRPLRKKLGRISSYLSAKADIDSERIVSQIATQVRAATIGQIARSSADAWIKDALNIADPDSLLSRAILGGENTLIGAATASAREGVGLGRLFGLDEVKDDVESVVYTAILDENLCDVCAAADGSEYGPDEAGQAPNDDCIGAQYGNECRCYEIYVFRKD